MAARAVLAAMLLLGLTGCESEEAVDEGAGEALEAAAIERGLIPGADAIALSGRYERRSDIGVDRLCATDSGGDHDIGMLAVYGPDSFCEARGTARRDGESIRIALRGKGECQFDARYDGIELIFPGDVPAGCSDYCTGRASLSGVSFYFVEGGDDAARSVPGRAMRRLCE